MIKKLSFILGLLISSPVFAINLIIQNTTGSTLSYLSGAATVPPNGSLTVPLNQIFPISRDPQLVADCKSGNAYVTDSVNSYFGTDCFEYLNTVANSLGGQVVGFLGSATPSFAIIVAAKDPNGNAQVALLDTNKNLMMTSAAQSSGTPIETSVSCATTTTTLLAASTATKFISIRNPASATATVWLNIAGSSATTAAPSIDLLPGGEADFFASENSFLPTSQINCISGGVSASTLTLIYK